MSKGKRIKRQRKVTEGGLLKEFSERMTANVQEEIRNSEMWDQMVAEFGEEKAGELLKDIKAEAKPGGNDEGRDSPEDIS